MTNTKPGRPNNEAKPMTYKSRTADKFVVRLPDGMRDRAALAGKGGGR